MWFFLFILWFGLCVDVAVDKISRVSIYSPLSLPPSVFFFILPTILSLTQVTFNEISARLKLASVPFSSLHFVIGHLEKSFTESTM